jgi:hypothetical protein
LISAETAADVYGVVLKEGAGEVEEATTAARRESMKRTKAIPN